MQGVDTYTSERSATGVPSVLPPFAPNSPGTQSAQNPDIMRLWSHYLKTRSCCAHYIKSIVSQVEHGSLAQRLGLVPQPMHHELSTAEWAVVARHSAARGDSEGCCSICRDQFRDRPQVLLSCSHTFHDRCLRSFERWGPGTQSVRNHEAPLGFRRPGVVCMQCCSASVAALIGPVV